jgi:hypothetical protein
MKDKSAKFIVASAVSIFIMSSPMTPGISVVAADRSPAQIVIMPSSTEKQVSIDLAENVKNNTDAPPKAAPDSNSKKSKPISGSSGQAVKAKSKHLKPFVPSEKIPAGQAVDFPADI